MTEYSISPAGERFPIPARDEYDAEMRRIESSAIRTTFRQIVVQKDLPQALNGVEAVIFAVRHQAYLDLSPDDVVKWAGSTLAVIDCFGILTDDQIRRYIALGCEVKGLGRGHIKRLKDAVRET